MADEQIKKESLKMLTQGMALCVANDLPVKGKFQFLQNIRISTEGVIESRPFLDSYLTLTGNPLLVPHSIKAILNKANSTFNRIVGAGTKLFTGNGGALVEKDTGYSGKPFTGVDFRPEQSIESHYYFTEGTKFKRVSVADVLSDVGITAPTKPVTWKIGAPNRKVVDKISATSGGAGGDWDHVTGSAATPSVNDRVNTTILAYLPDGALPNFASIVPTAFTDDIQKDSIVTLNGSEDVIVEAVLPAALNTGVATISKIVYDSGTSGACTIVLSISSPTIVRDSVLLLNGTEYVRVTDVTVDGNGIPSIRTSTVGTFAATNTVSGVASFRFYDTVAYVAGNTITGKYIKSAIGAAGISSITRTFNVDLLNTASRPLTLEDIFHISLMLNSTVDLIEIQIQLNVASSGTAFTENYFFFSVTPNFFTEAAAQSSSSLSVLQQAQQRQDILDQQRNIYEHIGRGADSGGYDSGILDPSDIRIPGSVLESALGQNQFAELNIAPKDFKRVGSDLSRTLKDVNAIRISINTNAAVDMSIDSLWVGGADGLETKTQGFLPYNYVWRIRDPATRTRSNWSPPLRTGIKISRGRVVLAFPDAFANYDHNYKIDIARFGGSINEFLILGSLTNDNSEYTDTSSDRIIADNDEAGRFAGQGSTDAVFDFYKPFAILDTPKKGTCTVVGTTLTITAGDTLSITYPRGVQIVVNGIANRFYTNPTSTTVVELERDMGSLVGVPFEIEAPLLTGQPLPVIAGPIGQGNFGLYVLGIGDKNSAGTLYWLDGNSPDTQSDLNRTEITSPSEPLIAMVLYDGFIQLYSSARAFTVAPSINSDGRVAMLARENANSRGVFSSYAIDVGPTHIFFLSENADGIYRVQGNGNPECITAAGFNNLFYVNGKIAPTSVTLVDGTIIYPPDFTAINDLRIFCTNDYMIFRFKDTQGKYVQLVFDQKLDNFISYDTFPNDTIGATYREELESDTQILAGIVGGVGRYSSTGVFEAASQSKLVPFAFDAGDARLIKEFTEEVISVDQGTDGFALRNYYDNGATNDAAVNIAGSVTHVRQQFIVGLKDSAAQGKEAKNITTVFSWLIKSGVKLFEEMFYYIPKGDEITDRLGEVENAGSVGAKLWQGVVIQANTNGEDKTLNFYDDRNVLKATLVINHAGNLTVSYSFDQPFISHTIRRTSEDGVAWVPIQEVYVTDTEPESAKVWEGEFNVNDLTGLLVAKRAGIAYRSTADATIKLFFDDGTNKSYPLPLSAGEWKKHFFYIDAKKFKSCKYRIESTEDIRVYKKGCEIYLRSYNSAQPFAPTNALGGPSNDTNIMI